MSGTYTYTLSRDADDPLFANIHSMGLTVFLLDQQIGQLYELSRPLSKS